MSRYTVLDAPEGEIVLGYDPPLRAFFGQRFDASRDRVIGGYPSRYGLGSIEDTPRLEQMEAAVADLIGLIAWAVSHGVSRDGLSGVVGRLLREWQEDPGAISTPYRLLRPALLAAGGASIEGDHVQGVCRIGQGPATCRYLAVGASGFLCEKHSGLGPVLDAKAQSGAMGAVGDNCGGLRRIAPEAVH